MSSSKLFWSLIAFTISKCLLTCFTGMRHLKPELTSKKQLNLDSLPQFFLLFHFINELNSPGTEVGNNLSMFIHPFPDSLFSSNQALILPPLPCLSSTVTLKRDLIIFSVQSKPRKRACGGSSWKMGSDRELAREMAKRTKIGFLKWLILARHRQVFKISELKASHHQVQQQ